MEEDPIQKLQAALTLRHLLNDRSPLIAELTFSGWKVPRLEAQSILKTAIESQFPGVVATVRIIGKVAKIDVRHSRNATNERKEG